MPNNIETIIKLAKDKNGWHTKIKTEFYNPIFQNIAGDYAITDDKNRELNKDSCHFARAHKHNIVADVLNFLNQNNLQNIG